MRQISAGIYNVLKSTGKGKMPVGEFLAGVSKSDAILRQTFSQYSSLFVALNSTGS